MTKQSTDPYGRLLYGAAEIGRDLGLSERQVRHLLERGLLPSFKVGGRVACRREDVEVWLAQRARLGQQRERTAANPEEIA